MCSSLKPPYLNITNKYDECHWYLWLEIWISCQTRPTWAVGTAVCFVIPGFITNFCPRAATAKDMIQHKINFFLYSIPQFRLENASLKLIQTKKKTFKFSIKANLKIDRLSYIGLHKPVQRCSFIANSNVSIDTKVTPLHSPAVWFSCSSLADGFLGFNSHHLAKSGAVIPTHYIHSVLQVNGTCCYKAVCHFSVECFGFYT